MVGSDGFIGYTPPAGELRAGQFVHGAAVSIVPQCSVTTTGRKAADRKPITAPIPALSLAQAISMAGIRSPTPCPGISQRTTRPKDVRWGE
jgi:hypothetical protein